MGRSHSPLYNTIQNNGKGVACLRPTKSLIYEAYTWVFQRTLRDPLGGPKVAAEMPWCKQIKH